MTPRRPSTASTDAGPSRLPFASAEALLWGPEMRQQHAYLLTEMRALQRQHEAYDARIQQTEAAAEAAEAATARVRHLEQQLAAIEAEDDDKAFEKWASGEMTRLGVFVDTNKHVRQKQIELCNEVSRIAEDLDRLKNSPTDLNALLRRFDLLENGRKEDTRRIKSLEGEVTRLKMMRPGSAKSTVGSRSNPHRDGGIRRSMTPPQLSHAEYSDADATTEDEMLIPPRRPVQEEIQVPRSPEPKERSSGTIFAPSATKGQPAMSARQRLMKRPSIHDTMLEKFMEEAGQHQVSEPPATQLVNQARQHMAPSSGSGYGPPQRRTPNPPATSSVNQGRQVRAPAPERDLEPRQQPARKAPATQLVNRASPRKRKQPEQEPPTQRVTRLQAKKSQESLSEQREAIEARNIAFQSAQPVEQTFSPRKKLKPSPAQQQPAQNEDVAEQATQIVTRSPRKKQPNMAAGPSENSFIEPTQLTRRSPKKTNKTNATTSPSKKAISSPSKRTAASPSKKAVTKPTQLPAISPTKQEKLIVILPNRRTNTELDRTVENYMQTSAADRVKMSPRKAAPTSPFKAIPRPLSARTKKPATAAAAGSSTNGGRADPMNANTRSPSRTVSPAKRAIPRQNDNTGQSPTRHQRVIPQISDYDEFMRLRAQGDLP